MPDKITSLNDLKAIGQKSLEGIGPDTIVLAVGMATCGIASGAGNVIKALNDAIAANGLKNVQVVATGCVGSCWAEPLVEVRRQGKEPIRYGHVNAGLAKDIVEKHVLKDELIDSAVVGGDGGKSQIRIALRNCGLINPESIADYIANDGYAALGKCLTEMKPQDVVAEVKASGLRGRGGAGFPTGLKWEIASKNESDKKYVLCNADEGDPGAFMDRSILEGDPHSILEAMAICGYAIGADEGIIYIRAEYPLAVARLRTAIAQAEEMGLLGKNILGTDFSFSLTINLGAGAFVCGEETALLNSVEGMRGEPRTKPPFPAEKGLNGKPSNINNVETFANVCPIINKGAAWFSSIGTEKSKGTKVFALAGKINNVGLVEVPMGTPLREIIYNIGGGIRNGKEFKAIQTGGPSGGCIPAQLLDMRIDYESLQEAGSMMGSGGMIVMDEDDCMVNIAKFYLEFTVEESCGKCTPCRIGTRRLLEVLERITRGEGKEKDLTDLMDLGNVIKDTALCGLGQSAPNPILSTIQYFENEYRAHIIDKTCPAKACTDMLQYTIISDKCVGCTVCARNCPTECISGERRQPHVIDQSRCTKCGTCMEKCRFSAISFG